MPQRPGTPADKAGIAALRQQLQDIDRKLQALSDGEVQGEGGAVKLQQAQAKLLEAERAYGTLSQALQQSQLAMAARLSRTGGWCVDIEQQRVIWSDEVCAIHEVPAGTTPPFEQAIGYYAPEWREVIRKAALRCAQHGDPYDMELELITQRGRRIWVRAIGEAVRDDSGRIRMIQGAFQDLSDRKQAEQEARQLAARLITTLESLTIGFHTTNRDWRFTYVNAEAERMLGRSREELLGKVIWEAIPTINGTVYEESFRRAMTENRGTVVEAQFRGRESWVRATAYPSEEGLAVHLRDISAERAALRQLKLLEASVSRLNDLVIITDVAPLDEPGPRIRFVNDALVRATGYSRDELIGATPRMLQGPDTERAELDRIRTALTRLEPVHCELINYTKQGEPYWLELDIVPVAEEGSVISHFVAVQRDITQRRQNQDELRQLNQELEARVLSRTAELNVAREQAEQATRAKSSFLAAMSHEIRTPMNGVLGMIDVLNQSGLRPQQTDMVNLIQESAESLLTIIDGILDFSKIEAGKFNVERSPTQLVRVVEKVCQLFDSVAAKKAVGLTYFVDPRLPASVAADELRLRQVLSNLVSNAIKFSSGRELPGDVCVRAEWIAQDPQQVSVEFSVQDNGIGIAKESLERLFVPFAQADASTTRRFGGTGLGLAICQNLVELMGGSISVRSAPLQGSTFSIRISFDVLPADALNQQAEPQGDAALVNGLSCRVIGTAEPAASDLCAYLRHGGAAIERFADLAEAARAAGTAAPGGLTLWIVLPGVSVPAPPALRALAGSGAGTQTRFVLLGRGGRRQLREDAVDVFAIDLDVLSQRRFFEVLAIAAGRLRSDPSPEQQSPVTQTLRVLGTVAPAAARSKALRGRILVAEDNETNRFVIQQQLHLLGLTSVLTVNGREALDRWRREGFQLILTDLHMPDMDGYALCEAIRHEELPGQRIPIIALTANAQRDEDARGRAAGMDDFLVKPVALTRLKVALEPWLDSALTGADLRRNQGTADASDPPADLGVLSSLIGHDPDDIAALLVSFRLSADSLSRQLHAAIADGAYEVVVKAAHQLKSVAASIGASRLSDVCGSLEQAAVANRGELREVLLPQFQAALAAVFDFLDSTASAPATAAPAS